MIPISLTTLMKTILVYCKFIYKKIVSLGQAIHAVWHDKNNEHLTAVQNPLSKLSTKKYVHQDDKRMHNAAEEVQSKKKTKKTFSANHYNSKNYFIAQQWSQPDYKIDFVWGLVIWCDGKTLKWDKTQFYAFIHVVISLWFKGSRLGQRFNSQKYSRIYG